MINGGFKYDFDSYRSKQNKLLKNQPPTFILKKNLTFPVIFLKQIKMQKKYFFSALLSNL